MPLMTGSSIPHPNACAACAGEEIVHSRWKHRGKVNPLVVGSNPTGPTKSTRHEHGAQPRAARAGARTNYCLSNTSVSSPPPVVAAAGLVASEPSEPPPQAARSSAAAKAIAALRIARLLRIDLEADLVDVDDLGIHGALLLEDELVDPLAAAGRRAAGR